MASRHANLQTHLLEFRQMLERRTAELAAQRHTADDRRRLLKAAKAVDATWLTQDREAQVEADMALHRVIAESAHNPVFSYLMASLQGVMRDHMKLTLAGNDETPSITRAIREQHAALVAAILSGNAEAASASAGSHLDFVKVHFNQM
jgi:GntR family transcriptional regulator, transcriptional repressor for pyruvate dehydrogenase complex